MPFVRCRHYTEGGEPVKGGCRRKDVSCAFIHPGDPRWDRAPMSFKARDKGGDSGGFKPWVPKRATAASSSTWDAGGNSTTGTTDSGGGWDTGGWGGGSGWGDGSQWGGAGGSASTPDQAPAPARSSNSSVTNSRDTASVSQAEGNMKSSEHASNWGNSDDADRASDSGWGNMQNGGWNISSWGGNMASDQPAEPGWPGVTWNSGSGSGGGDNNDATNSRGAPDPMIVDNQTEKETRRNKGKGKAVPAPPRIRIPDYENKGNKITNNEPPGSGKQWGEARSSNFVITSTPVATSTPITALTPTDSSRLKRKRDVASDDKLDVFKEYVKAWERGVRARFLLAEAEAKRDRWFRTQKSACYARIGEAGRKRLDGERAECDKEVKLQGEKLSCALTTLVDFHDTLSSNIDLGQRYNIGEQAETFIAESKTFVDEIRDLLVKHVLEEKNGVQSSDVHKHASGVGDNPVSIDSLRSQVRDLEERYEQAQTGLTVRCQREIHSKIDECLSAKIQALRAARQREIDRVTSLPQPEINIPPSAFEGTAKQIKELDAKVPQVVEDIRVLLLRVDATTKRVRELEEELSVNKATYNNVQEMAAEKEKTEQRMNERMEKIREQFEQLAASQPSDAAKQGTTTPTTCNSREKLMESVRVEFQTVLDKFYEREVRPTIETLQQAVIQASDRHQEEAIKVLWGKIQPAMNMVAGVSRWLDSQELQDTAPVDGAI